MRITITKPESWPRRRNGQPIFKTTQEAVFYANLITKDKKSVDEIDLYLKAARRQIKAEREKAQPNLDRMMELATKGQFYRECLDEVKRIRNESKNPKHPGT